MNLMVSEVHDTHLAIFETVCNEEQLSMDLRGIGELLTRDMSVFDDAFKDIDDEFK